MAFYKTYKAEVFLDKRFLLGEGPAYDSRKDEILWVDIRTGTFCKWLCKEKKLEEVKTEQSIGAVVPAESGRYLAALTTGVFYLDENGLELICRPPELADNMRLNDAKCDPAGRFWFGTMRFFDSAPEGSLFCLDKDKNCRRMLAGPKTSNGMAWSSDRNKMYYIDSRERGVDVFDYDIDTGNITNRKRILETEGCVPDGMTIDDEGMLWIALWGGSRVIRFDPESEKIIGGIPVPSVNTTSCCFAGEKHDTLIITTSGEGFDDLAAGRIYCATPGVTGSPTQLYRDI